jgi:hypothetical protein
MVEYKIIKDDSIHESEKTINELSKYGWMVVSITTAQDNSLVIVLKRELEDPFKK